MLGTGHVALSSLKGHSSSEWGRGTSLEGGGLSVVARVWAGGQAGNWDSLVQETTTRQLLDFNEKGI